MVTRDTVDEDIYEMQQRKAKMNAAILDTDGTKSKEVENEEVKRMLQGAVDRYLQTPSADKTASSV